MDNYLLGAYFCRSLFKQVGVSIFILNDFLFHDIDLQMFVKEKDFEICALSTKVPSINLLVLCVYRSPTGDFAYFMDQLEQALCRLHKLSTNIVYVGILMLPF
jgi:hypothetical protein